MRLVMTALALAMLTAPGTAQHTIERPEYALAPINIQLDGIPTSALVVMLLRDVMRVPYVIAPDVLSDRRATSVKLIIPRNKIPEGVVGYLRRAGFTVQLVGGTIYVTRGGRSAGSMASSFPMGSPLAASSSEPINYGGQPPQSAPAISTSENVAPDPANGFADPDLQILAYIPAHRPTEYFASVVGAVVPGLTFGARGEEKGSPTEGTIAPREGPDVLVMSGTVAELAKARQLVQLLDRPRPMVAVKAVVMQVQNIKARGSALSILANIGGGKLQVGSFGVDAPAAQFVRIATGAFSAVLSAVREDSRFKVVATPNLAALSGGVATMNSGSQVPTIGSVSIAEGGTPVQSVVYRDSGITLTVRPVVRGDLIELDVREERSTFVRTTTGVEDSPTLQKSSASASVVLKSGESVVLAGLTEASAGNTREGLFGGLLGVRSRDKSDSELLVLIQAELVPSPVTAPGQFIDITDAKEDALAPA